MRLQTRSPVHRSAHSPSRAAAPASRSKPRREPAGQPRRATLRGRRHGGSSPRSRLLPAPARRSGRPERAAPPAAPPFGLTLAAMTGTGHCRCYALRRPPFALALVLAVLALACFPVLANADSSTDQYTEPLPTSTGSNHPPASTSGAGGGASASSSAGGSGSGSMRASSSGSSETEGTPVVGSKKGTGQGTPAKGHSNTGIGSAQQYAQPEKQTPGEAGGLSPLLPILIGIAVLAAISIGVVLMRGKRRHRDDDRAVSAGIS